MQLPPKPLSDGKVRTDRNGNPPLYGTHFIDRRVIEGECVEIKETQATDADAVSDLNRAIVFDRIAETLDQNAQSLIRQAERVRSDALALRQRAEKAESVKHHDR